MNLPVPLFRLPLILSAAACLSGVSRSSAQTRAIGIDVSDWQNQTSTGLPIDWARVHQPVAQGGGGKDFAFIRSTRGGTTGTYNEHTREGTLSHRYDDFAFTYNITNAKAVGMLAGPYHFGRADLLANTGIDEANHMLEIAGPYMKPGYLRLVFDLEAGNTQRSTTDLTNFALDFANRIYEVKGIYPLVYINSSYANDEVDSRITIMDLWIARWPNQGNPSAIDINGDPPAASGYPNVYGVWNPIYPQIPDPTPWKFWQYTSNGHVAGIGDGVTDRVDLDVAHGSIEFVKDFLVPALWSVNNSGQWTTASNWNASPDLPGANDRVIIDRAAGDFLVTLGAGSHSIRSLSTNERFSLEGGSLSVQQYAQFNNIASFSAGMLNSGSIINNALLHMSDGSISTGPLSGNGSITVLDGQIIANSIRQNRLAISDGLVRVNPNSGPLGTSTVSSISITGSGQFDLATNAMVVDYTGVSSLPLVKALIMLGYDTGSWNGPGIMSSHAAANAGYGLGYAEKSTLEFIPPIFGLSDPTSVFVRYTRYGDADLDGIVSLSDFNRLATNFGSGDDWVEGDFNYDGIVNLQDFNRMAANFGLIASPDGPTPQDWAALASAVPEPVGVLWLCLGASLLTRSRRRAMRAAGCGATRR